MRDRPALDLRRARPRRRPAGPGPARRGARGRATGSASGRRTAPSGCSCSTRPRRSASCSSPSTRPTAPPSWRTSCSSRACALLVSATEFKGSDYRAMVERGAARLPGAERVVRIGTLRLGRAARRAGRRGGAARAARRRCRPTTRSTCSTPRGTTGFPKGATLSHRNILNNGFFVTDLIGFTEQDRLCVPVPFYHCFGMVMGNLGCTSHGACIVVPAPRVRPGRDAAGGAGRALHRRCTACRRCSSRCRACATSRRTTCRRCAPASWPARRAR